MKLQINKKTGLRVFNIAHLRSWRPCYDPVRHLAETFKGDAVSILKNEKIPVADRLWVVLRTDITSERVMRLFAVWSYRQTLALVSNPDPRSIACANVAEAFAEGKATQEELSAAWSAARSAARSAAWSAAESAESAAWSAAESAAWSAARSAAWSAARSAESAAWSAAESAESAAWSAAESAESAAWSAARSAESAAWSAAWSAARSAAWSAQVSKLIEMLEIEGRLRLEKNARVRAKRKKAA